MTIPLMLTLLMLLVIYYDATRYIIPNWLNGSVLVLCVYLWWTGAGGDWKTAALGMLAMFSVGFIMYTLKWMGAGDVKLLAALAPFFDSWRGLGEYAVLVALVGGFLSLGLIFIRKIIPWIISLPADKSTFRILREGSPVPYGLAISTVFLWALWSGKTIMKIMQT